MVCVGGGQWHALGVVGEVAGEDDWPARDGEPALRLIVGGLRGAHVAVGERGRLAAQAQQAAIPGVEAGVRLLLQFAPVQLRALEGRARLRVWHIRWIPAERGELVAP